MGPACGPGAGSVGDEVGDGGFGFNGLETGGLPLPRWLVMLGLWGRLPWFLGPGLIGLIGRPIGDWGRPAPLGFIIGPAGEAGREPGPGPIRGAPLGGPLGARIP